MTLENFSKFSLKKIPFLQLSNMLEDFSSILWLSWCFFIGTVSRTSDRLKSHIHIFSSLGMIVKVQGLIKIWNLSIIKRMLKLLLRWSLLHWKNIYPSSGITREDWLQRDSFTLNHLNSTGLNQKYIQNFNICTNWCKIHLQLKK